MILPSATLISLPEEFTSAAAPPKSEPHPFQPALALILALRSALWQGLVPEGGAWEPSGGICKDEAGGGHVPQDRGPSVSQLSAPSWNKAILLC